MLFKIFCAILLLILEVPFYLKLRKEYDIIRQTAIVIIMGVIIPLIIAGIYFLGIFILK